MQAKSTRHRGNPWDSVRNRRTSTLVAYRSIPDCYRLPTFGPQEIGSIRKPDFMAHFNAMREAGATVSAANKALGTATTILNFALEQELIERNVLTRFRAFERDRTNGIQQEHAGGSGVRARPAIVPGQCGRECHDTSVGREATAARDRGGARDIRQPLDETSDAKDETAATG